MERRLAYYVSCPDCFKKELIKSGFEIENDHGTLVVKAPETKVRLGDIYDFHFVVYPETSTMDRESISERTRLVRMCDDFKI